MKKLNNDFICTRFITITPYAKNTNVDIAKGRLFPSLRGTLLPSFDKQVDGGIAVNWLSIRIRVSNRMQYPHPCRYRIFKKFI